MAAITSSDVTVTLASSEREIAGSEAPKGFSLPTIAFGNGVLTYPTGGVPLPDKSQFGFKRGIEFGAIQQPLDGFVYKYDPVNHKVLIYTQGVSTGTTAATTNGNGALVKNSAGAEAAGPRLPNTAASTTYDMGPLIELPATVAPPATSFKVLMVGQ